MTLSGGLRPTIDLTGSSSNAFASASGSISYFFRLDKLVEDAPDELVPIRMSGSGSLSQTKDYAFTSVTVGYQGPKDPGLVELRHEQTSPYTPKINFNYFYTEWLKSDEMAKVSISASGWAATPYIPPTASIYHGEFQAILDPWIEIAPYSLYYHNQWVPAVNLYSSAV